jgi:hypothetical protein
MKRLKAVLAAGLAVCVAVFVVRTLWWPFIYDAALIRYANFLMAHHLAPYREIQDYNLPGSYFFDWLVTHTLGASALAWRVYDLLLLTLTGVAMYRIARPYSRFAGFFAAMLFVFFHARDGAGQSGQRDLLITALVLVALAIVIYGDRQRTLRLFLFGLCIGVAATVKPVAVVALPLLWLVPDAAPTMRRKSRSIGIVLGGFFIAPLAALLWLWRMHCVAAFWRTLTVYIPFHAHMGHLSFWPLLTHCITASHGTLLVLALVLAFGDPAFRDTGRELRRLRTLLGAGMGYGLISYFVQAKGYPDHRYPFAAFLFLFAAVEFTHALRSPGYRKALGVAGLLFGTVLSVLSMQRGVRERWPGEQVAALTSDLNALGGHALSSKVQCLDTVDGCIETLYDMRLVQSTGFVYDEFLFAAPDAMTAREAEVQTGLREEFLHEIQANPPQVIVVTPRLFPSGPYDYAKLDRWPRLAALLGSCYRLQAERDFPGGRSYHREGYRLYLHVSTAACLHG